MLPWRLLETLKAARRQQQANSPSPVPVDGQPLGPPEDVPIPAGVSAQQGMDEWLGNEVVTPMAERGWPNLGAAMATIPSTIGSMVIPQSTDDLMPLPAALPFKTFAKGGIVNSPTLGMVGEAGPEAIIPIDELLTMIRDLPRAIKRAVMDGMILSQ